MEHLSVPNLVNALTEIQIVAAIDSRTRREVIREISTATRQNLRSLLPGRHPNPTHNQRECRYMVQVRQLTQKGG
jgi:hypothetical protein